MILDEMKKANIQALKDKDALSRSVFSVFFNKVKLLEISKRESGESLTEAEVVATLQKMLKELEDEKNNYSKVNNTQSVMEVEKQMEILSAYLPKMMSEQEIYDIISAMEDKTIPAVMKKFKSEYAGKCDMRVVSEVLKKFN